MTASSSIPSLRRAIRSDIDEVARLWMALHSEFPMMEPTLRLVEDAEKRFRNDFAEWVGADVRRIVVVDLAGRLVGFISAELGVPPAVFEPDSHVFVEALYVEPAFRRSGLGRRLVASVFSWCQGLGADRVRLGVLAASTGARAFWTALGAREESILMSIEMAQWKS